MKLTIPALRIQQTERNVLYSFAVDAKTLPRFITISRISRGEDHEVDGYQRPEVLAHIQEIRKYIESDDPMMPNALVVAFDSRVHFEGEVASRVGSVSIGQLVIPIDDSLPPEDRPGWIVDGQQRMAAVRDAQVEGFPLCVTAFITDDVQEQRSQFILVNSTKPLPKGLIYELLPSTDSMLPTMLQRRKFPAFLAQRLNFDSDSPMLKLIRTPTNSEGLIKDNSVLKMIENSLTDGALYQYRDPRTGEGDSESMLAVLKSFWLAVSQVFPDAWGENPRRSRLMHGAGIVSMGFLMDAICDRLPKNNGISVNELLPHLEPLRPVCKWTTGYWDFGPGCQIKWNEVQNTSRDIQVLSNYLLFQYRTRVWDKVRTDETVGDLKSGGRRDAESKISVPNEANQSNKWEKFVPGEKAAN